MKIPAELISSLQDAVGFDETNFLEAHGNPEPLTSIRLNPKKLKLSETLSPVPWSSTGYYLPERPIFTLDPLLHAGAFYVQEASSMFLEEAMKQCVDLSQPLKILDLCAAPGGKSTLLQSLISKESLLVSNEVIKTRVNVLVENIAKWGAINVVVTNNDPSHFQRLQNYFNVLVVDAPCSGSGLFRRDPAAIEEWSLNNVKLCSQRQQRILADVLPALKQDGVLIYSTCSYSREEDENIVQWLTKTHQLENIRLQLRSEWGIVESGEEDNYGYRFYPGKLKGEGFFISCFRKKPGVELEEKTKRSQKQQKHKKEEKFTAKEISILSGYVKNVETLFVTRINDELIALPAEAEEELSILQSALYIKKAGVTLGRLIGNELLPDHELAVSEIIHDDVPAIEVNKTTALQYLRREDLKIETHLRGWALIKFSGSPLGWVKLLPNRINNYYPKDWRILMR